jgi:hypothetical protein
MKKKFNHGICFGVIFIILAGSFPAVISAEENTGLKFEVTFTPGVHSENITGRVYVILASDGTREPRFQVHPRGVPFFGKDVSALQPGAPAILEADAFGYPYPSLNEIPPGEYYVQAFIHIYTRFERSDGHVLWMHQDQWEGQRWNRSPGNVYSQVRKISINPGRGQVVRLSCTEVIPEVQVPPDTKWVKRIKIQSRILSEFWGQPVYLGAVILLPKGYHDHTDEKYPVNYMQGHFSLNPPYGFREKKPSSESAREQRGFDFYQYWISDDCPRMLAVTFQHPCPYYDDSYAVNSPNVGPYGDAIMQELIPVIEEEFRIIQEPFARILSGGSTGGWISLALQIFYPDFFGGVFSLCPDPVDFRYFQCVDIYGDENAYYKQFGGISVPTPSDRLTDGVVSLTYEQRNHFELALGTKNRSGQQIDIFEAAFGPVADDGYVKPLFDKRTGEIDSEVAEYWKEHYDLRYYLEKHWPRIGSSLEGKLHIYTGDMDTHYLNNAVVLLERFLEKTKDPYYAGTIAYGDGEPHCWGPYGEDLIELMGEYIEERKAKMKND